MTSETGRRFCRACGHSLSAGDRFCGECGAAVPGGPSSGIATARPEPAARPAPSAEDAGERRQVAILFADLSGFTELSRTLDPEDVHNLLERYFELVDQTVARFGGTIDKHTGDGAMALFGAPVAHGNDPERAVRCALAIHAGLAPLSQDLGVRLTGHIGIASGEVIASDLGSANKRDYTVLGHSVNLASRLMGVAGPEQTVVSVPVHRAVANLVEAEALEPMALKGIAEPVTAYRVLSVAPAGTRPVRGAMIGRRAERRQFVGLLAGAKASGAGAILLVRGDAGIGKTRLVASFRTLARKAGFKVHAASVLDFGSESGHALGALLRSLLGLKPDADEATRRATAERAIARGDLAEERRLFLHDLLDLPLTAEMRATFDAMASAARTEGRSATLARLARRRARRKPRVFIVEDVHWADRLTLETLARLARGTRGAPYLLVMTTRPEGDPVDAGWRAMARDVSLATIDLAPLQKAEAEKFARRFLAPGSKDARRCVSRAGGNPLFLEQLLMSARAGELERLPGSVQSVVLARIDRLEPPDRRAIQAASVLGQRFTPDVVAYLLDVPIVSGEALVRFNLVRPLGQGYLFAHALIREGVYGSLLKRRRQELHARAAQWFATRDAGLHAEHLERAQDSTAPDAYLAAARQQAAQYRHVAALASLRRGLAIAGTDAQRHALHLLEAEVLREIGQSQDAVKAARQAFKFASNELEQARALISAAEGLRVLDRLDEAMIRLDKAERLLAAGDHPLERSRLYYLRGNLYFPLGRVSECLAEHERALIQAKFAASVESEVRALGGIADALYAQGRFRSALEHFERCVNQAEAHGFGRIAVANRPMLCATASLLGRYEDNRRYGERAIADAVRAGNKRAELVARIAFSTGEYQRQDFTSIRRQIEACETVLQDIDAPRFKAEIEAKAALLALHASGRGGRALALAQEALACARQSSMAYMGPWILGVLAAVTTDDAERAAALAEAEALLAAGALLHNHAMFYPIAIELSVERTDWGEAERYASLLEAAFAAEPSPRSSHEVAVARALAWHAREPASTAFQDEIRRLMGEQERLGLNFCRAALEAALKAP